VPYVLLFGCTPQTVQRLLGCKRRLLESWWVVEIVTVEENCFFNLEILPHPSKYILSLLTFEIENRNKFLVNSKIYHVDTRQHANFHQPSANLTKYQKGVYYLGAKVFKMLPSYVKIESDDPKKLKLILQKFLFQNSFYSLDEYFEL